jgi:hypothetical protein
VAQYKNKETQDSIKKTDTTTFAQFIPHKMSSITHSPGTGLVSKRPLISHMAAGKRNGVAPLLAIRLQVGEMM